jgi:hypothetical protein
VFKKLSFSRKERGGDPPEGIPSNQMEARNQMKTVSSYLSVQKLIFFKEMESWGSTRRDSIQPDRSKKSYEGGKLSS